MNAIETTTRHSKNILAIVHASDSRSAWRICHALGSQITPLVIAALTEDENFFALVLYDKIQSDDQLIVQYEPDDPRRLKGEQGRAALAVGAWLNSVLQPRR